MFTYRKSHDPADPPTVHNCRNKEKLSQQNAVSLRDQQSVSHWMASVSQSVSKSKLVYSSLIFVDNKLTLICLVT